jgi:hypothetical protein
MAHRHMVGAVEQNGPILTPAKSTVILVPLPAHSNRRWGRRPDRRQTSRSGLLNSITLGLNVAAERGQGPPALIARVLTV